MLTIRSSPDCGAPRRAPRRAARDPYAAPAALPQAVNARTSP